MRCLLLSFFHFALIICNIRVTAHPKNQNNRPHDPHYPSYLQRYFHCFICRFQQCSKGRLPVCAYDGCKCMKKTDISNGKHQLGYEWPGFDGPNGKPTTTTTTTPNKTWSVITTTTTAATTGAAATTSPSKCKTQTPFQIASTGKGITEIFSSTEIVPDVVSTAPTAVIHARWPSGAVMELGNELIPSEVKDQPQVQWEASDEVLYTLCMLDPDAPSRAMPNAREWQHWLVVNIPGCDVKAGKVMTEYMGPTPPQSTGKHRYVVLVYKQPGAISPTELVIAKDGPGRAGFKMATFAAKYKLEGPKAGNFFEAQWEDPLVGNE